MTALEYQCVEFITFLYQDARPLYWAGDFLSGMKRCFVQGRRAVRTANRYYNYWVNATPTKRALPISSELVRGMATYFLIKGRPRMALAFLVGFLGLLCMGEVTALKMKQVAILHLRARLEYV